MYNPNILNAFAEVLNRNKEQLEFFNFYYNQGNIYRCKMEIYQACILDFSLKSNQELNTIILEQIEYMNLEEINSIKFYIDAKEDW